MQFEPIAIRDWSELESYKRMDGGPSEARIAGETLLRFCMNHQNTYYLHGVNKNQENAITLSNDLFNFCSPYLSVPLSYEKDADKNNE